MHYKLFFHPFNHWLDIQNIYWFLIRKYFVLKFRDYLKNKLCLIYKFCVGVKKPFQSLKYVLILEFFLSVFVSQDQVGATNCPDCLIFMCW